MSSKVLAGRYVLLEKKGDGGMAVVYKGKDRLLNRYVAIKILKPEFIKDPKFIENFRRESQAAARLSDPNIVSVFDVGRESNIYFIVMELIEGNSLGDLIKAEAPFSEKRTIEISKQIASGLSAAHKKKIIHRDIKPHNILMTEDGVPKIADFGIAKAVNGATIVNKTTTVMGSVHYLSPEQAKGGYVDARTDIYSLGIVMYEMLTGKVPFDGENAVSVAMMHINSDVPAPSKLNTAVSHTMDEIVMKAAARSPEQRYSSADELIEALDAAESGIERQSEDATKIFGLNDFYAVNPNPSQNYDDGYGSDEYYEPQPDEKVHNTPVSADDLETSDETARKAAARKAARESKKKKKKKSGNRKIKALAIILALICAIPLSLLAMNAINGIGSGRVKVPDVVGMTEEQAYEALSQAGLEYELGTSVSSDKYDDGDVVSTDPSAGTKVKKGSTVVITLAKSSSDTKSKKKAVPDVRELTLSDARDTLTEQGFKVGTVSYKYDDSAEKGTVISQSPGAGTSANEGSTVSLTVSNGREEQTVEMPSITGLSESAARSAIAKAGLSVGTVSEEYSDESVGTVISQGVSPGTSVKKGESVSFVISKGKKPSESDSSSSSNSGENNSNNSSSHNSDNSDNSDNNSSNSDSGSNNSTSSGVTDDDDASAQSVGTMKYNIDYSKAPNDPFSLTVTLTKADGSVKTVVPTRLCFKSQKSSSVKLSGTGTCMLNVQMDKKTFTRKIKFS
ncbi:MAG: Stk1 family PASTA domain-containing Ser/Thr kinase [Eubacteriales bacterium]|nr:Stk1 family PASTA domain-containing Ser/Thr kinase [Eubacteriales bacterium]